MAITSREMGQAFDPMQAHTELQLMYALPSARGLSLIREKGGKSRGFRCLQRSPRMGKRQKSYPQANMNIFQKIGLTFILIGAMLLAAYLFVWFLVFLLVAAPIVYFWWRWKMRKIRQAMRRRSATDIIEHKKLE